MKQRQRQEGKKKTHKVQEELRKTKPRKTIALELRKSVANESGIGLRRTSEDSAAKTYATLEALSQRAGLTECCDFISSNN